MTTPRPDRGRTALFRSELSKPVQLALTDGVLRRGLEFFDYGCGRGGDLRRLKRKGIRCSGWDPRWRPGAAKAPADVVNLGYVVNVVEDPVERVEALREAWALTRRVLIVSARLRGEARGLVGRPLGDGLLTRAGTFQKFFGQTELREWIAEALDVRPVAVAPGIFYVFREDEAREGYLASRYRRRSAKPRVTRSEALYREHEALFRELGDFYLQRGRLPHVSELVDASSFVEALGSVKRAWRILLRVTEGSGWEAVREERRQDLLVYLALARFEGRGRFTSLDPALQLDIRALFGSYKRATGEADALLFSVGRQEVLDEALRTAPIGKVTGNALYFHRSALERQPPLLRIYEGCGRALAGEHEEANLIKLHRGKFVVSYLAYPDFDRDPHPALVGSLTVRLRARRMDWRDFTESKNPPILHRKELFVAADYPGREKFARLTAQEERWGLYDHPELIGRRAYWQALLRTLQATHRGHRLIRLRN